VPAAGGGRGVCGGGGGGGGEEGGGRSQSAGGLGALPVFCKDVTSLALQALMTSTVEGIAIGSGGSVKVGWCQ
jgi:hypothetical protein